MPKQGPKDGSLRQIIAFLPIAFKASPSPTVVVVFPSPAGVGVMAVTSISFPSGFCSNVLIKSRDILAL
jgi:hypothetical protein